MLLENVNIVLADQKEKEWIEKIGLNNLTNGNVGGGGNNSCGAKRNDAYKNKFNFFLKNSNYSKNSIKNSICYLNKFIDYFKSESKSPKEINSKEIADYIDKIDNKNTRNANIVSLKLFYKSVMNQPNKLKNIKYEYN